MTESVDPPRKSAILVVDDSSVSLNMLARVFLDEGYTVHTALNGPVALEKAHQLQPDLILLDIMMPGMDGYAVCQHLKAEESTRDIPVIFLSALSETDDKLKAFDFGGVDYITKPFQIEEALARVETHLKLRELQRQLTRQNSRLQEEIDQRRDAQIMAEAANQKLQAALAELERLAMTDKLTGAYNRRKFDEIIAVEIQRASRYKTPFSLVLFDIDHFKRVNDVYGHEVGDLVLTDLAKLVQHELRSTDALIRWGGEEMVILAPGIVLAQAAVLAERVRKKVAAHDFPKVGNLTISLGIGQYQVGDTPGALVQRADEGLYLAKSNGRNQTRVARH